MEDPASQYASVVQDWYVKMDEAIGKLPQSAKEDTYVLIMSDHGSVPVAGSLYINEFLRSQGLLACNVTAGEPAREKGSSRKTRASALRHVPPRIIRTICSLQPRIT